MKKRLLTTLTTLALAIMLFCVNASAAEIVWRDEVTTVPVHYGPATVFCELDSDGLLRIYGNGSIQSYTQEGEIFQYAPWYYHGSEIKNIVIEEGITRIGDNAFTMQGDVEIDTLTIKSTNLELCEYTFYTIRNKVKNVVYYGNYPTAAEGESLYFPYAMATETVSYPGDNVTWLQNKPSKDNLRTWIPLEDVEPNVLGSGSFEDSSIQWKLTSDGVLSIEGEGMLPNDQPWKNQKGFVYTVKISSGITEIESNAFYNHSNLTNVILPDTLTRIGDSVFQDTGLKEIELPSGLTYIGKSAFKNTKLVQITLPKSIRELGNYIFESCKNLKTITVLGQAPDASSPFYNSYATLEYPADDVRWRLMGCTKFKPSDPLGLETFTFRSGNCGENVTWKLDSNGLLTISGSGPMKDYDTSSSAPWEFYSEAVLNVVVESGVTTLGKCAFQNCKYMQTATIADSVTVFPFYAFAYCSELTELNIPANLTEISSYAFGNCSSLTKINISNLTSWIENGFANKIISDTATSYNLFLNGQPISDLVIPEDITVIAEGAFSCCNNLTSVTFPASAKIESIGHKAFGGCLNLETITFCGNRPSIPSDAFNSVTADAAFPALNITWDLDEDGNYGGDIDWTPDWEMEFPVEILESGNLTDSISWTLTNDGILELTGTGPMPDYTSSQSKPWQSYNSRISAAHIGDGITTVGQYAFNNMYSLAQVTVPDTVTTIGSNAFADDVCVVTCLGNAPEIQKNAFARNMGVIIYPKNNISWGPVTESKIGSMGWQADDSIPVVETVILSGECGTDLTFTLTNTGVLTITGTGEMATLYSGKTTPWSEYAHYIKKVDIKPGCTLISNHQFKEFYALTEVSIPDTVTTIESNAFQLCLNLEKIVIPDSVVMVGDAAFSACPNLKDVTLSKNMIYLQDSLFSEAGFSSITIPNGIREIRVTVFSDCENLTSLTIPASVHEIQYLAFADCTSLTEVTFEGTAPYILENAFYGVTATIYYNGSDSSWNDIVGEQYKGTLTWKMIPGTEPEVTPSEPDETTPTGPSETPPTVPDKTQPSIPEETKPAEPEETKPSEPDETKPSEPEETTPSEPDDPPKEPELIDNPFVDVKEKEYFYTPVLWAVGNNITNGMDATHFSPEKICTRGQIVTFLWRAQGEPEPASTTNPFKDVKATDYYYKAVLWAVENGITNGTGDGVFSPNADCTRGQVATFLWRSMGEPTPSSQNHNFTDIKTGEYYYTAVLWAVENGVTNGTSPTTFAPNSPCTRGQIVTFLYRTLA